MSDSTMGPMQPTGDDDEYLGWGGWSDRKSASVMEAQREVRVTYPHPNGGKPFRTVYRQKPNPIGFHARLPGDKPRTP